MPSRLLRSPSKHAKMQPGGEKARPYCQTTRPISRRVHKVSRQEILAAAGRVRLRLLDRLGLQLDPTST